MQRRSADSWLVELKGAPEGLERTLLIERTLQNLKLQGGRELMYEQFLNYIPDVSARWSMAGYCLSKNLPQRTLNDLKRIEVKTEEDQARMDFVSMQANQMLAGRHPRISTLDEVALAERLVASLFSVRHEACAFLTAYDGRDCLPEQQPIPDLSKLTNQTPSVKEETDQKIFSLYPNPAQNEIHLHNEAGGTSTFEVWGLTGQRILKMEIQDTDTTLDISEWPSGAYLLKWHNANGQTENGKLIVSE